jgi:lipoprotein signal peptidase
MKNVEWGMGNEKQGIPSIMLAGILLLLDQMAKYYFSDSERAYCNPDGPWGMPADNGALVAVMVTILAGLWYLFRTMEEPFSRIALSFILAGGVSNLSDRIVFGCVRDHVVFHWFPAFNPADVFLTVGAALLLFVVFVRKK